MKRNFHKRINIKILGVIIILFAVTIIFVSIINESNIRKIYEKTFTERVLLTNSLIANVVDSNDIDNYVISLRNKDQEFKQKQINFYYDRREYFDLLEKGASEQELAVNINRMKEFHNEMSGLKNELYWKVIESLKSLRDISKSKYIYVLADTGVYADDGIKLYTYIFDADDDNTYDDPDSDGLGTVEEGEDILTTIYETKKPMDTVEYYAGNYGELYFAYAPILDNKGNVIAILGTDVDLVEMREEIRKSMSLFSLVFISFLVGICVSIYIFVNRYVSKPLGELTVTARKIADGDVYTNVPAATLKQNSELGILARAINDMSGVYQRMIKSTEDIFSANQIGKLDVRNDSSIYKGDIKKVIEHINDTLDAMTLYLNSVPEGIFIMSKNFEMYFRNDQFINFFGNISAKSFMTKILTGHTEDADREQFEELLTQKNHNLSAWINDMCFSITLNEINLGEMRENSVLVIAINITDLIREKENAQAAARAKSDFLSRMSHEMRTPMNAIIGMTQIAEQTEDVSKWKYCFSTIETSSKLLLGIINDVLDMSKIEAGKFELENIPFNIEKMLINICDIMNDNMQKKKISFNVSLANNIDLNYTGDELRLSQVITNLLSNAVKFTAENGRINLIAERQAIEGDICTLYFSVSDTGIGMNKDQMSHLFVSFEQADGSITRRFGGTGLGLAISKNIVEKMDGRIWVESEYGKGSTFKFTVKMERSPNQEIIRLKGINPKDINVLLVENDPETQQRFLSIMDNLEITTSIAKNAEQAIDLAKSAHEANKAYDIIFLEYNMPGIGNFEIINQMGPYVDSNKIIFIISFLEWEQIEDTAHEKNISHYITKPFFPSRLLNVINSTLGITQDERSTKTKEPEKIPDFSGINILLVDDVEINRDIFIALLERTKITIDTAENGLIAVSKFRENPGRYKLIVMDIQMPEMDGYDATRTIRAIGTPEAKSIPIIALTANAFKEDIDLCLASGMNDHLAKPIDEKKVVEKILKYSANV